MITARQCLEEANALGAGYQLAINAFIDGFRAATPHERAQLIAEPIPAGTELAGLLAAVVSVLARESETPAPPWVSTVGSPRPFFVLPAKSFAMRVRLMLESPPAFRARNVFVPENFMHRA